MSQTTKSDIVEKIEYLRNQTEVPLDYSVSQQGYFLENEETHERYGPICNSKPEFMVFLRGVDFGIDFGKDRDTVNEMAKRRDDMDVTLY